MVVSWIKADWNLIGMTLVSAELITGGKDIMICRQKVQVYISIGYKIYEPNWHAAWLFDFLLGWRWPIEASWSLTD